jgi:hypothetical protein
VLFEAYDTAINAELGNAVVMLTSHPNFPNNPRDTAFINRFYTRAAPGYGDNAHEQYGGRLRALFIPFVSGNWRFFASSDDNGELWLNPAGSDPAGRTLIAREPGCCNVYQNPGAVQTSAAFPLTGGQGYYLEMLYKEGGGGDWAMVAARLDGTGTPVGGNDSATGEYLDSPTAPSPFCTIGFGAAPAGAAGSVNITQHPANASLQANMQATFTVAANAPVAPFVCYQWERSDDGGTTYTPIAGATKASYTTPYLTVTDDNGDRYRVVVSIPGQSVTSNPAQVTVAADTTRPRVTRVLGLSDTNIAVFFSEPLPSQINGGTADDPLAYEFEGNASAIGSATINSSNSLRVDLGLSPLVFPMMFGSTYTLKISTDITPIVDGNLNNLDPNPTIVTFVSQNYSGDVNTLATLPTSGMLPVSALTDRGFAGRLVQVGSAIANNIVVNESLLNGTFQSPTLNIAPAQVFWETNFINYNKDMPTNPSVGGVPGDVQFPGYPPNPTGAATAGYENMAMEVITYLHLQPLIYRFGVSSDDGFKVTPAISAEDPNNSIILGFFNGGRGNTASTPGETTFDFLVTQEGLYPFRLIWEQGTGGGNVDWWEADLTSAAGTRVAINANPPPPPGPGLAAQGGGGPQAFTPPCTAKRVAVALSGTNCAVTWPIAGGGNLFALQQTASLAPPVSWSYVQQAPQNVGGNKRCVVPLVAGQNRFFRLYKAAPPNCP